MREHLSEFTGLNCGYITGCISKLQLLLGVLIVQWSGSIKKEVLERNSGKPATGSGSFKSLWTIDIWPNSTQIAEKVHAGCDREVSLCLIGVYVHISRYIILIIFFVFVHWPDVIKCLITMT